MNIDKNQITDERLEVFLASLKNNPSFESLNLGNNNINIEGIKRITTTLQNNHNLRFLSLSNLIIYLANNYIDDVGAKAIGELLKVNDRITCIDLGNKNYKQKAKM